MTRLVMFSSPTGGAGKTTQSKALADALADRGERVRYCSDDILFEEPALADLAEAFRTKTLPGADQLVDGFERLLGTIRDVDWIIQETNWMMTGEDLPWAQASWDAIVDYTRDIMRVAAPYEPGIVYLELPVEEAMRRMEAREGRQGFAAWIGYMRGLPALAPWADAEPAALLAAWAERVTRIWADAGVDLVRVDARGSREEVLDRALSALDARWI